MATEQQSTGNVLTRYGDLAIAGGIIGILALMLVPLRTGILDMLLVFNITFALIVLLTSIYTRQALEFSVFPSLLLVVTLFRLALNVASTRLILLHADAGRVISSFGHFVVGGNYVVGLVIFLILVVIQFVVITKGAGRIAEVAARFTLDAMPGKQMSIDADLNAGLIDENEARQRRDSIRREADFYGAMDGASKFVRGDAIAGIIITIINIIGGFIIGVVQMQMPLGEAIRRYTLLTVGDGLVTQIPALVISTAAGIVVTRAAGEGNLGTDLIGQLLQRRRPVMIAAVLLTGLGLVPGLPTLPFLLLAGATAAVGFTAAGQEEGGRAAAPSEGAQSQSGPAPHEVVEDLLAVDPMEFEMGYGLVPLVDASQGGDLLDRVATIRRQCALELGIIVPPIHIHDNIELKPNEYVIKIRGVEVARGEAQLGYLLAMNPGNARGNLEGISTTEPAFDLPATWITKAQKERAVASGYTVVDAPSVIATHLTETIRRHAADILSRQDVQRLLDTVRGEAPAIVDELVPNSLSLGEVQRVLQNLLRERVCVRDLVTVLETLGDYARGVRDTDVLAEHVRRRLGRSISAQYADSEGHIPAITIAPRLEQTLIDACNDERPGAPPALPPEVASQFYSSLATAVARATAVGEQALLICSPRLRLPLRRMIERSIPNMVVLSYVELPQNSKVRSVGMMEDSSGSENAHGLEYAPSPNPA